MENQDAINEFIINVTIVEPISKIIAGLNGSVYRDCDINWLDNKLDTFVKLAAQTLGIQPIFKTDFGTSPFTILNDHNKKYYISKFETLLAYFKTF